MSGTATLRILNAVEDRALDTCATCPSLCRWACPVAETEARETTSPHRLAVLAGLLKGKRVTAQETDGTPYHCSHCMACTEACLHDNDVSLLMSLARARILEAKAAPPEVRAVIGQFAVSGNPAGRSLQDALKSAAAAVDQPVVAQASLVYWPGCETLASDPEVAGDALRAVALSGRPRAAVTDAAAQCCGLPLLWAGQLDGFRAHADRFAAQFARTETVVAHDPTCAHAVRHRYREVGITFRPQVVSLVEYLAGAWPAAARKEAAPALLDGCTQARGLQQTSPPRALIELATGSAPVELAGQTGVSSDCCGGQGLLPQLVPGTASAMAQSRIDAFRASGAQRLLTASPRCRHHLKSVDPTLPVDDLIAWLAGR